MQALATRNDPIFAVTGVPAADILERCARIRALPTGGAAPSVSGSGEASRQKKPWCLSQFSQGSNPEFVQLAYIALLKRPATQKEAAKRLRQLSSGKTRLGILVRLMLLPESCEQKLKLRGFVLVMLRRYALFNNKRSNKGRRQANTTFGALPATAGAKSSLGHEIFEIAKTIPKIGRMRREIKQLSEEVRQLRARIEQ